MANIFTASPVVFITSPVISFHVESHHFSRHRRYFRRFRGRLCGSPARRGVAQEQLFGHCITAFAFGFDMLRRAMIFRRFYFDTIPTPNAVAAAYRRRRADGRADARPRFGRAESHNFGHLLALILYRATSARSLGREAAMLADDEVPAERCRRQQDATAKASKRQHHAQNCYRH